MLIQSNITKFLVHKKHSLLDRHNFCAASYLPSKLSKLLKIKQWQLNKNPNTKNISAIIQSFPLSYGDYFK